MTASMMSPTLRSLDGFLTFFVQLISGTMDETLDASSSSTKAP
jgi:hypothetical protein